MSLKKSTFPNQATLASYSDSPQTQQEKEMFQKGTPVSAIITWSRRCGPQASLAESVAAVFPEGRRAGSGDPSLSPVAVGPQLHLQDFTTMLDSCSTLGVLPT